MAKYKGTGLSGKIKIVDSAGNFSSTDLKTVLENLMDGAGGSSGGVDYAWKKHQVFLYDGVSVTKALPTNWTHLRFRFMAGDAGDTVSYDNFMEFTKSELTELSALGFNLACKIGNGYGTSMNFTINLSANTYTLSAFASATHHLLVFYKNEV